MNILALSLLRIGDVLMAAPALQGLRQKYPKSRIHLVVNKSSMGLARLMPYVDQFIEFNREEVQHGLVDAERPLFEPFDRLSQFVSELNQLEIDLAVNFTQNNFSGYLMGLIEAKDKVGLAIDVNKRAQFNSAWFKHLNDVVEADAELKFHYSDIFYYGLNLERGEQKYVLQETAQGQEELLTFLKTNGFDSGPKVVLQALTSDSKKNWGHASWVKLIQTLHLLEPRVQIILLGAPSEMTQLTAIFDGCGELRSRVRIATLSLEGALSLLQISDLLITGDTSIKHLAAATGLPIIELALGSSHVFKTGAYAKDALVLSSQVDCYPCAHSELCSKKSHECALAIDPELVAACCSKRLRNDWPALHTIAQEYADVVKFHRIAHLLTGVWYAQQIGDHSRGKNIANYVDLAAWQFYLDSEYLKPLAAYGSEGLKLKNQLELLDDARDIHWVSALLSQIEVSAVQNELRLDRLIGNISRDLPLLASQRQTSPVAAHLHDEIIHLEEELKLGHFLSEKIQKQYAGDFYGLRQLQSSLNTAHTHQQIKIKLLRSLKNQIKEYQ